MPIQLDGFAAKFDAGYEGFEGRHGHCAAW